MSDIVWSDALYMRRCLALAQQALGKTAPNPLVGSVIVKGGHVIGEGFHPAAGQPHAEIFALKATGSEAEGATLYVNLEPCNHQGRTPPCTGAILQAGIQSVVVGMVDPNPLVAGKGIERLRAAGLTVKVGVEENACQQLNEAFSFRIRHQRPFGILKFAMTLDGKIATDQGHSAWITEPTARCWVHQLRSHCQAVIVGGNTVRRDNPHLTTHGIAERQPLRVVLSRSLNLPEQANLWDQTVTPTLICTQTGVNDSMQAKLEALGVEVKTFDSLTPTAVMAELAKRGCLQVLWECGGRLAAQAIMAGVIQKVHGFVAPKLIGGQGGYSPIGDLGCTQMTEALCLENVTYQSVGRDFLITGYLANREP